MKKNKIRSLVPFFILAVILTIGLKILLPNLYIIPGVLFGFYFAKTVITPEVIEKIIGYFNKNFIL
jgi:hypothetical protein